MSRFEIPGGPKNSRRRSVVRWAKIAPVKRINLAIVLVCLLASYAVAQGPSVLLDNERVRVLRVTLGPHEKAPVHSHPESVVVYVSEAHEKITTPDGKVQEVRRKAGETSHSMPMAHAEENLSDQPLEFVLIEMKKKPAGSSTYTFPADDPVKIDSKYHTVDFENDQVRVLRTVLEPHIKAPMHSHPAYVVVYLTNLHTKMAFPDGTVNDNRRKKGDVAWRDALKHSTENVEDQHAEEIQVEMK